MKAIGCSVFYSGISGCWMLPGVFSIAAKLTETWAYNMKQFQRAKKKKSKAIVVQAYLFSCRGSDESITGALLFD